MPQAQRKRTGSGKRLAGNQSWTRSGSAACARGNKHREGPRGVDEDETLQHEGKSPRGAIGFGFRRRQKQHGPTVRRGRARLEQVGDRVAERRTERRGEERRGEKRGNERGEPKSRVQ